MLVEEFKKYLGTKEYTGIVATIQEWFYGTVYKASWCATSASYFMNRLGKLYIIGGKNENVYHMMNACQKYAASHPEVRFYGPGEIPSLLRKDDILFWLWSGEMGPTGNKHVGVCAEDTTSKVVPCIGGNQKDMICVSGYPKENLYAVYRWVPENNQYTIGWHQDDHGWWYADTENTWLHDTWKLINHHWYYFGSDGYAVTGYQLIENERYFFETAGPLECALLHTNDRGALVEWLVEE